MSSVKEATSAVAQTTTNTPLSATRKATHAALSTKELLCNIVAHFPFPDVLAATGVCRDWRATLVRDPTLREDLFLKAAEVRLVIAKESSFRQGSDTIPLDGCIVLGTALPLLKSLFDNIKFAMERYTFRAVRHAPNPMRNIPASAFEIVDSFWRDMFVTQPPCSNLNITIHKCHILKLGDHSMRCAEEKLHDINCQRAEGIKLGHLYDIIHSSVTEDYDQFFIELTIHDWIVRVLGRAV
jgi:hypothetical protein